MDASADAPSGARGFLDLPMEVIVSVLTLAGRAAAGAACSTCRALRALSESDAVWTAIYKARYERHALTAPEVWGLETFRDSCRVLKRLDLLPGLYVCLSDYPWGQLVAVRLDAGSGRLVGQFLMIRLSGSRATVQHDEPLFATRILDTEQRGTSGDGDGMLRTTMRTRAATLLHSKSGSEVERELVRRLAPIVPPNDAELLRPWLANLRNVHRIFHRVWPLAQTVKLHSADLLLCAFEPAQRGPDTGAQPADVAPTNAAPPREVSWLLDQLEEQWRRRPADVWQEEAAGAAEPSDAAPSSGSGGARPAVRPPPAFLSRPFLCLGRLHNPSAEWPAWPSAIRSELPLSALPQLGYYAADYGMQYGERRVEVLQLRVETLPLAPLPSAGDASAGWFLKDDGTFAPGGTYLLAVKVCGDSHVPQGATSFAVQLLDAAGNPAVPEAASTDAPADGGQAGYGPALQWPGHGCVAYTGFRERSFTPGHLKVLAVDSFAFSWRLESTHLYHRLPFDDLSFSFGLAGAVAGERGARISSSPVARESAPTLPAARQVDHSSILE